MTNLTKALNNFKTNGISHESKRLNEVLDFQDIIGRMSFPEISAVFNDMDKDQKGIFLWASCSCLCKDTFLDIIKRVVCVNVINEHDESIESEYQERFNAIVDREQNMTRLERENAIALERIKYLELELSVVKKNLIDTTDKAAKYNKIKDLLK